MRLVLVFSGFLAALARGATPIDAALARDKAARRIEAALAGARAAGVPDAERYDAAWVAESRASRRRGIILLVLCQL